jgi:Flp pilus assembly protein TadG
MRIHRDERGQTIILVALSLPLLLGFIGIATDVGALFKDKRTMQTAADAGAIAGALNLNYGNTVAYAAARAATATNGYTDGSNGAHVTPINGPTWSGSNYAGKQSYLEVTITKTESTIFLALFGYPSVTVQARAVATNQAPGSGCLYTVGTTGTGFTNNGTVDVEANTCGLVVESSDPNALVLHGTSDTVNLGSIGVVGGDSLSGSPSFPTAHPVTGIAPESDPLNFLPQFSFSTQTTGRGANRVTTETVACTTGYDCSKVTIPSTCQSTGTDSHGNPFYAVPSGATLSPGCYATLNFPSSGTVTLDSGLYMVGGDVNFSGSNVNSSGGVTFYTNGSYNFGSGTYTLSAPNDKTALWNGILFAESLDDTNGITFGGNASTDISGVVYAPAASFNMHGNPSITLHADFVVHDITLSGNVSFNSYDSLSGVASALTSIALVE